MKAKKTYILRREAPMNKIVEFSVRSRGLVLFFTFVVALVGFLAFRVLPIDAVPDVTNKQVVINTEVQGLVPEEIERNVTYPVEMAMQGIAQVTQIRSTTRFGLSQVTVVFEENADLYRARQLVSERLSGLALTNSEWKPQLGPITTGLGEIFHYALDYEAPADTHEARVRQLQELRAIQDWWLKPRLMSVKGIAEVNTAGGYEREYHILPKEELLQKYGISFMDIEQALTHVNKNVGGAYVQQTAEQFLVQGKGLFKSIEDIEQLPLRSLGTLQTVRLGDLAEVKIGEELRRGAAVFNGREGVIGTTLMLMGENSRVVAHRVAEALETIQKDLPKGMKIYPLYDRADLVEATLGTVESNLALGGLLVVVILMLLLGNFRAALITALVIPLSLLGTFIGMKVFKVSGNLMSLGALDFGIIVDGAVIVMDNIVRRIHDKKIELARILAPEEVRKVIVEATIEIRKAAGFGQLIIVMIFLPIITLTGVAGKMFRPMAATFAICLFIAMIISFTTVPALAAYLLGGNTEDEEPKLMKWIHSGFEWLQNLTLRFRWATISTGVISFFLGAYLFLGLGGEFIPQLDEGTIAVEIIRPVNSSLEQNIDLKKRTHEALKSFPEVKDMFSRIGTSKVVTDPVGMNQVDNFVSFHPRNDWPKRNNGKRFTKDELLVALKEHLEIHIPGQRLVFSQPIQMRFNELLEGTRADVTLKIFGPDMDELVKLAQKMRVLVAGIPGSGDVQVDLVGTSSLLRVEPKPDVIRSLALSPAHILETVEIGIGGKEVGFLFEQEKRFPIVLRLNEKSRRDLESLKDTPVPIGPSATLPLDKVANVDFQETYGLIARENASRRVSVLINPRGRDTKSFVEEAIQKIEQEVELPFGYRTEWGGDFKNLEETSRTLSIMTPLVLLAVFFMVFMAFHHFLQTVLVFLCVPLALVGGVLALVAKNLPFSISAGVGFIALSGIAVLNGVVLVSFFNELRAQGKDPKHIVKDGTLLRLRPVLMTALVDVFGFLPMMFATGAGAEIQQPLAAVVVGGIISATLLTLVVLPAAYLALENWKPGILKVRIPEDHRQEASLPQLKPEVLTS